MCPSIRMAQYPFKLEGPLDLIWADLVRFLADNRIFNLLRVLLSRLSIWVTTAPYEQHNQEVHSMRQPYNHTIIDEARGFSQSMCMHPFQRLRFQSNLRTTRIRSSACV